ncbi:hypothetical protein MRX96_015957 [Rhipicephalus microplus]
MTRCHGYHQEARPVSRSLLDLCCAPRRGRALLEEQRFRVCRRCCDEDVLWPFFAPSCHSGGSKSGRMAMSMLPFVCIGSLPFGDASTGFQRCIRLINKARSRRLRGNSGLPRFTRNFRQNAYLTPYTQREIHSCSLYSK